MKRNDDDETMIWMLNVDDYYVTKEMDGNSHQLSSLK